VSSLRITARRLLLAWPRTPGLSIDDNVDNAERSPKWGKCTSTHVREQVVDGQGQALAPKVNDGNYPDNSGSPHIEVIYL
jgi:hypothetical protein